MNTKELIKNTFGTVATLTIAIFVIVFIAYGYTDIEGQLKETLTITIGVFGGLATLGAAYIAANLFNDWKEQHNKQVENQLILTIVNNFNKLDNSMTGPWFELHDLHKLDQQEVDRYFNQFRNNIGNIKLAFLDTTTSIERLAIFSGNLENVIDKVKKYNLDFLIIMDELSNLPLEYKPELEPVLASQMRLIYDLILDIESEYVKKLIAKLKV